MPELEHVTKQKTVGFVDRGYNYNKRKKQLEEDEAEITKLEAEIKGEKLDGEGSETTQVQNEGNTKQEKTSKKVEASENDSNLSAEEKSFKKRYGDIRKHLATKEKEWKEKYETLEKRLAKESIVPPKSDEDIEVWQKKYPDVAGLVEAVAAKKAKEMFDKADLRLQEIDKAKEEADRVISENTIRESHSDFDKLRNSDEFHDWAEEQPKWVKDALYENADDPASVVRVIDLYKIDNNMTPSAKKEGRKKAASSVTKSSRKTIDADGVSNQIKESDIQNMSTVEFEERQDEINEALRKGNFVYDITGSAR